jgi:hypothetical protein
MWKKIQAPAELIQSQEELPDARNNWRTNYRTCKARSYANPYNKRYDFEFNRTEPRIAETAGRIIETRQDCEQYDEQYNEQQSVQHQRVFE